MVTAKSKIPILLLEDDFILRQSLARPLAKFGRVFGAGSVAEAMQLLSHGQIKLAFIDLNLGKGPEDGLPIIRACKAQGIETIVLTNQEDKEIIAKAFQAGCHHYFSKFEFEENIDLRISGIIENIADQGSAEFFQQRFITRDRELMQKILMAKNSFLAKDQRILLTGPTGVGKSVMAKALHEWCSPKSSFVHVNLQELPENLLESELFGHVKGAFTGAIGDKQGLFSRAHGGTLFLDEIGVLPLHIQTKLLRVLEEKTFSPLGSNDTIKVDFRLITATCDDLSKLILAQKFRVDLYFRIKGLEIEIPGLKDRTEDIVPLIDHFIKGMPRKISLSSEAEAILIRYHWFGNIRELKDLIGQLSFAGKGQIQVHDLPFYIRQNINPIRHSSANKALAGMLTNEMAEYVDEHGLNSLTDKIQAEFIQRAIIQCHGKINEAARSLGISKSLFYRHFNKGEDIHVSQ